MPVMPALARLKQEDLKFKTILGNAGRPWKGWGKNGAQWEMSKRETKNVK
jgi:hypothetical protein